MLRWNPVILIKGGYLLVGTVCPVSLINLFVIKIKNLIILIINF